MFQYNLFIPILYTQRLVNVRHRKRKERETDTEENLCNVFPEINRFVLDETIVL
jgi:hypothetical protein